MLPAMSNETTFSLETLAEAAGVPQRQIRELIRLGVIPAPSSQGRGATYGPEHLDRLRAWKVLREQAPAKISNEQLRKAIDQLGDMGALRSVADGKTPIALVDDGKEEVTLEGSGVMARQQIRESPASQGPGKNESALAYLHQLRNAARRVTMPLVGGAARIELGVGGEQTGAGLPLDRLQEALARYVADHAKEVRVKPPKTETWQRVAIGRDLEISARGPLMPDEIQLLETIGQLLQQAIYRKEK
jgi:DNA-binding transcriptional MerR regulator